MVMEKERSGEGKKWGDNGRGGELEWVGEMRRYVRWWSGWDRISANERHYPKKNSCRNVSRVFDSVAPVNKKTRRVWWCQSLAITLVPNYFTRPYVTLLLLLPLPPRLSFSMPLLFLSLSPSSLPWPTRLSFSSSPVPLIVLITIPLPPHLSSTFSFTHSFS